MLDGKERISYSAREERRCLEILEKLAESRGFSRGVEFFEGMLVLAKLEKRPRWSQPCVTRWVVGFQEDPAKIVGGFTPLKLSGQGSWSRAASRHVSLIFCLCGDKMSGRPLIARDVDGEHRTTPLLREKFGTSLEELQLEIDIGRCG